jgi:gamma-glutamyltranspeptidase/glutathione hydrolase
MIRIFAYGQNPQVACDAPRWLVKQGFRVGMEIGFKKNVLEDLLSKEYSLEYCNSDSFGDAQIIHRMKGGYLGASDHHKGGQAFGF